MPKNSKKIYALLLLVCLFVGGINKTASAQFVPTSDVGPLAIKRTADTTMLQVKNYVLDGLAWTVAKIMLQQVTASVVNWINSGFQGSPAFITDPGSFFADAADQLTGNFIAETGILSRLCSPFSLDVRLNLALSNSMYQQRYQCTLSTVINNVKNSRVSVNGNVSYNGRTLASGGGNASINGGASIDGFVNGDMSQGGWPAYIAMTTEPQNNAFGAFLQAKSDLEQQIANKQNNLRFDLSLGNGFLSWKNCKNVDVQALEGYESEGVDTLALQNSKGSQSVSLGQDIYSGNEFSLQKKIGKNGEVTYQDCQTETPGSVIAGSINKALGVPQDTLNIAGSLNQIVGALFAQLVTKVLSGGLHSASAGGSGYTAGVATQLIGQQQGQQIAQSRDQLAASAQGYYSSANQYLNLRVQALTAISGSLTAYDSSQQCFAAKASSINPSRISTAETTYAASKIAAIDSAKVKVNATISQFQTKLNDAQSRLDGTQKVIDTINGSVGSDQLQNASETFNTALQGGSATTAAFVTSTDISAAESDLEFAKSQAAAYTKEAAAYQKECDGFQAYGF